MDVDKEKVSEVVSVFYSAPFKVFFVNTDDGVTYKKAEAVFVSLGLTASIQTITDIKNVLNSSGYKVRIAELKTTRVDGQFLNMITDKTEEEVSKYSLDFPEDSYDAEKTEKLLSDLIQSCKNPDGTIQEDIKDRVKEIQNIKVLQSKLETTKAWDTSCIIKDKDGEYKIFRKMSNYKQLPGDISYRIGIYVEKE